MKRLILACAAIAAVATPVAAQRDVTRRSYTFFDNNLTIDVVEGASGVLQVMRGEPGRLEVAARAPRGVAGFGLGGRDNNALRLTALGSQRVEYLVIVPEDVRIRVRLPGRSVAEVASRRPSATYSWGEESGAEGVWGAAVRAGTAAEFERPPEGAGPFLSYYSPDAAREVIVSDLGTVNRVELRFEGADFRVYTDRPARVNDGRTDRLELRGDADQLLNATILLPPATRNFTLVLGGKTAFTVRGTEIRSFCDQLVQQRLGNGVLVYTFHPAGPLRCR